jgi:hypothetical protein
MSERVLIHLLVRSVTGEVTVPSYVHCLVSDKEWFAITYKETMKEVCKVVGEHVDEFKRIIQPVGKHLFRMVAGSSSVAVAAAVVTNSSANHSVITLGDHSNQLHANSEYYLILWIGPKAHGSQIGAAGENWPIDCVS